MTLEMERAVAATAVSEIPVLDIGPYLAGVPGAREALARDLARIQQEVGFYYVINHGVDMDLIDGGYRELARFFALPAEEKVKVRVDRMGPGWIPAKSSIYVTSPVNKNTKPDLNEALALINERPEGHADLAAGLRFIGPNKWPSLPGFRETISACHGQLARLARDMLPLYALALGKPADFFAPHFTEPMWTTRNAWYPAVEAEENQFGISPHQDHGFITALPVSEVPGLQIRTRDGRWLSAQTLPGGILINTGEFLNRWTNGRFIATPHRVMPPARDRYSMALFFNPSPRTVADPKDFARPGEEVKYEPISMHDYLCWYFDRNFAKSAGGDQDQATAAKG